MPFTSLLDAQGTLVWSSYLPPDLPKNEAVGMSVWELVDARDKEKTKEQYGKTLLTGEVSTLVARTRGNLFEATLHRVPGVFIVAHWNWFAPAMLTDREVKVLVMVCDGIATSQIAKAVGCSVSTVETHKSNIREKTGTTSIAGMVRWAIQHGIITP